MLKNILIALLALALLGAGAYTYTHQSKPSLIPDLKGKVLSLGCWSDASTFCSKQKDGSLIGITVDYYNGACRILNCVADFKYTDTGNMRNMLLNRQIDGAPVSMITQVRFKLPSGKIPHVANNYGLIVRDDSPLRTFEDFLKSKTSIIAIRKEWPFPVMQPLFADHKELNDWPQISEHELLSRGAVDVLLQTGVRVGNKIVYSKIEKGERLLEGNPPDSIGFSPTFIDNNGLAEAFDIATAIMISDGEMDAISKKYYSGETMTWRAWEPKK